MATASHTRTIDRREVMNAAWQLMRTTYRLGSIPFRSIGRKCLGWCMGEAWRRAREAAKLAALSVADLVERIAVINAKIENARFSDSFGQWAAEERAANAELARLVATARAAGLNLA
jgi:uncharacterized small protein (DUF1192 family)